MLGRFDLIEHMIIIFFFSLLLYSYYYSCYSCSYYVLHKLNMKLEDRGEATEVFAKTKHTASNGRLDGRTIDA